MEKYKLQKIVFSMGLGNKSRTQIDRIKVHFTSLLKIVLGQEVKPLITSCRKSNSKFKIRKGAPCGLKITFRKGKMSTVLKAFSQRTKLMEGLTYNNSGLFYGIPDHRLLRLQKYNYEAPSYGFNIALVFSHLSSRIQYRRINPLKNKKYVPQQDCRRIVSCI